MAQTIAIQQEDINSIVSGGSVALATASTTNYYYLYSSSATVISGAVSVAASSAPTGFVLFNMVLGTSFTFGGGGSFTFFGTSVSEGYLKAGTLFQAIYDGSSYTVSILPSFSQSGFIQGSDIADTTIALAKLANGSAGFSIVYNGSGVPTAVAPSGDWTQNSSGVNVIGNNAITTAKINNSAVTTNKIADEAVTLPKLDTSLQSYFGSPSSLISFSVTIPSADVLTANATPVVLVGAVAGKTIRPIFINQKMVYNSAAYATNGVTQIKHNGAIAAIGQSTANSFLFGTVSRTVAMSLPSASAVTDTQYLENADLIWTVDSGNPTAGDSDVTVSGLYVLIDA